MGTDQARKWLRYAMVFAFVAVLLRAANVMASPFLWAEDGAIFYSQAIDLGIRSLIEPYAGYLHILPRLGAYISCSICSPLEIPVVFHLWAIICHLGIIAFASTLRTDPAHRIAYVVAVALFPIGGLEILGILTNIQWISSTLLFFLITTRGGTARGARIAEVSAIILLGLSGPFCLIALPFFVSIELIRRWRGMDIHIVRGLVLAAVCAIQLAFILTSPGSNPKLIPGFASVAAMDVLKVLGEIVLPFTGGWFAMIPSLLILLTAVALMRGRLIAAMLLSQALAVLLLGYVRVGNPDAISLWFNAQRYATPLSIMVTTVALAAILKPLASVPRAVHPWLCIGWFLPLLAVLHITRTSDHPDATESWRNGVLLCAAGLPQKVSILPSGFAVESSIIRRHLARHPLRNHPEAMTTPYDQIPAECTVTSSGSWRTRAEGGIFSQAPILPSHDDQGLGSWCGNDTLTGELTLTCHRPVTAMAIGWAWYTPGRPTDADSLYLEVRTTAGTVLSRQYAPTENGPVWYFTAWDATWPDVVVVRAVDQAKGFNGWIAISPALHAKRRE